jgi:hypothetical protein
VRKLVALCLLASTAVGAEPPDWYAHIPPEQRAALLAARHAEPPSSLIGSGSPVPYRGPVSAPYAAPQSPARFDASALVHPPQNRTDYRLWLQDRERRILWGYLHSHERLAGRWRADLPLITTRCRTAGCGHRRNY